MTINPKLKKVWQYILDRGQEKTTWLGIFASAGVLHIHLNVENLPTYALIGTGICSVVAIAYKES